MPTLCGVPRPTLKKLRLRKVKAKAKCCQDRPRCKECPVTLMRLDRSGHAERQSKRRYLIAAKIPRKVLAVARAR